MTGYQSKKAAALDEEGMYLVHHTKSRVFDKLGNKVKEDDDDTQVYADALTIAYQSGFFDGKKAAQRTEPVGCVADIDRLRRQMFLDLGYSLSDPLYTTPPAQPAPVQQEPDETETLHYHAFNYRNAHVAQAHELWLMLEKFVDRKIKEAAFSTKENT